MNFSKEADEEPSLSLTSLIDVIFLLLIFFMVTTTLIDPTKKLELKLPEAKAAAQETKTPATIEMDSKGQMTLNGEKVTFSNLESRLSALAQKENTKKTAVVRADKGLGYGEVVRVLGICRASGFTDINIAVK